MFTDKKTNRTIYANLNQSVIRATLRSFDLYPTFLEVIKDTPEYTDITTNNPMLTSALADEESVFWDSDECTYVMNELFDALDSYAPDGYYFGPHEGDGSDFGYWEYNEDNEY